MLFRSLKDDFRHKLMAYQKNKEFHELAEILDERMALSEEGDYSLIQEADETLGSLTEKKEDEKPGHIFFSKGLQHLVGEYMPDEPKPSASHDDEDPSPIDPIRRNHK